MAESPAALGLESTLHVRGGRRKEEEAIK